jgi:putative sigma-54 modulation protein
MPAKVEVQARNMHLNKNLEEYVNKKAEKLDHYLPAIEDAHVELTHHKTARNAMDRNVAQITVRGKDYPAH